MSLHNEIMNIQIDEEDLRENLLKASFAAYKVGHRDARHEAAEMSLCYEKRIEELENALRKAQEDINWMLNSEQFLSGFVFDYIDQVLNK